MSKIDRKRTFFSLNLIILLSISSIRISLGCTLCMDAKVLSYFPGLDLLSTLFLMYTVGRLLSAWIGGRKIIWKWVSVLFLIFFIISINFGIIIAMSVTMVYLIISHIRQMSRCKRPFNRGEKIDFVLLITLIIALGGVYKIGKLRETDDQWLLRHLGIRATAEINYQRLTQLSHIDGLCEALKKRDSFSYFQETNTGWLSRLALEKKRCKKELRYLYTHKREESLSSVYIPLLLMTDKDDDLWVEICKDQSFFDRSYPHKDWIVRFDEARKKVMRSCSP